MTEAAGAGMRDGRNIGIRMIIADPDNPSLHRERPADDLSGGFDARNDPRDRRREARPVRRGPVDLRSVHDDPDQARRVEPVPFARRGNRHGGGHAAKEREALITPSPGTPQSFSSTS